MMSALFISAIFRVIIIIIMTIVIISTIIISILNNLIIIIINIWLLSIHIHHLIIPSPL